MMDRFFIPERKIEFETSLGRPWREGSKKILFAEGIFFHSSKLSSHMGLIVQTHVKNIEQYTDWD